MHRVYVMVLHEPPELLFMKMIVIGSSFGGLEPTKIILDDLPSDLDAAVLIVRHSTPGGSSVLSPILASHSDMPVSEVYNGCEIIVGHVYVTPPGVTVKIERGESGNAHFVLDDVFEASRKGRPSIDDALISAATVFGKDCIGVILSGYLDDGSKGAVRIDRLDGTMIVQSPGEASQPSMPLAVIKGDASDFIVPSVQIGPILRQLVSGSSQTQLDNIS